ncbi:DUF6273 domain-containing protein [uncultured Merdimonas sp.]|uniref:DUF6273 domain-containing protein n=1 Tax=uncultured Merdimonas sp. TaxID=2023269 RepID=UPI00320A6B48
MKAKKRFLSLLLVMCLMIGILPVGVLAAENRKALQAGAGAIEKNDTVYYGTEQRAWQVLSANGNGGTYSDGANAVQADSALFLFLRSGLRQLWFDDENSNNYKASILRAYLNNENVNATPWDMSGYVSGYFSEAEWANVLETTKTGADTSLVGVYYSGPGLDGDRLFALSANELMDYLGYSDNPASCTAGLGGKNVYWLRSAAAFDSSAAGAVYSDGLPSFHNVDLPDVWVRPAFNLNLNSVLFTSAAVGGKSSGAAGADALTPISEYTGSEWKLTLKDSSRSSFSIGTTAVNGNTLTVAYSGAKTGTNEYISAVIKDENGEISYYGRIKQAADSGAASGTVEVTLPADFDSSTDTLYLFSEQYNGDKMTDYAGALQEVSLAKNAYTVTYNLTNVAADTLPAFITGDSDFTAALSTSGDYALPGSIAVTVGGTALTADSSYTYNASTGSLTIYSSAITGDIVITAGAEAAQISAPDVDVQSGGSDYASGVWTDSDVTFTISGSSAPSGIAKYQYSANSGASWSDLTISGGSASLTVSDNSTTADGTSYIFRAVSNSGTEGAASAPITVKIDKTEPTITASGNTGNYLQNDTVTVSVNTGFSGVAKVEVSEDGGEAQDITQSYADGYAVTENGTYTFTVTNGAGVTATSSITYDKLDQTKPVVSLDTHGYTSDEWTNGDVTLSVSDTSAALGDTKFVYKAGDGEWQEYTDTITVSNETDGTVYSFRAISASGVESETVSVTVKIDKTAPDGEIVLGTNHWNSFLNTITFGLFFKDTQSVEVAVADDSVVKIEYLVHEGDGLSKDKLETQTFTAYTGKFSIEPDKKFVIYVRLTDHADNVTYLSSNGIVLDGTAATAPTVTTNGYTSGNWTDEDVTITVSGSSALSGIDKYQVSTDNGTSWTDMTMTNGTASLTVSDSSASADGTTYIFRAVSNSGVNGNTSAPITVKIDKTAPTLTLSGNTDDYLQNDTVTVSVNTGFSGVAKVEVSEDGGEAQDITQSYADGYAVTENGTYTFTVTSGAGVTATSSITYDKLDQTKPVVSLDTHGYTSDEWTNGDVTLSVSDTSAALGDTKLEYKVGNGEWQAYTDAVTVSEDTNGTVYSFRAISASGVESETVSVTVKIDKTAPDGDITIEENSVKKFIHDVTFGLFFKENVDVAITGTDNGSGVQTIEYNRSAKVLTEEQVAALTDWTAYAGAISETAQDAEQFVYYVRITDNAGNTICFASNGATFDLTKPVITGVTDGADYYTTQSVQATDTNLASVTLNGKEVGTEFTIAGNTETEYVIVAADKAGNETTVTVTMHKTEALRENLGDITKDNATSADRETVQDYLDDLKERLEDEELTDEEKTILEGLADEAQDILDRIDEAERAGSTEAVDQTQDITSDNVTPEDKEALEQAKEDIEQALDEFGGNYTDEEKAELEEELSRIEEALDVIERIEDTEAAIEALPDTVNPDDTKAEEQINAAKDLYDALSDYEKSLISADAKDKLEGLLAALRDYRITEGSGSTFTKGSSAGLTFTANGAYSKFTGIEVDGKAVDTDCYTAENGSTIITLKAEYLETLAAGEHTLTVLYTDGKATGTFTVTEKPDEVVDDNGNTPQTGNDGDETGKDDAASSETGDDSKSPETGDDSNIALWIAVMLAAGAALTGTAVYSRRRKYSR